MKIIERTFHDSQSFIDYLYDNCLKKELIILGGHYLLIYNEKKSSLESAIWQDSSDKTMEEISKTLVGNFPVSSFKIALELRKRSVNSRILLLVNDHFFQLPSNSFYQKIKNESNGNLKTNYYKNENVPNAYLNLIEEANFDITDVLFENPLIKSKYYNQFLWSETSLRKKFDKKLKYILAKGTGFFIEANKGMKSELFYRNQGVSTCITENGGCGCSGEVMQLLWEVSMKRSNEDLLLLVPSDCYESVCTGVEAFLNYNQTSENQNCCNIMVASGINELDYINNSYDTIYFRKYIYEPV